MRIDGRRGVCVGARAEEEGRRVATLDFAPLRIMGGTASPSPAARRRGPNSAPAAGAAGPPPSPAPVLHAIPLGRGSRRMTHPHLGEPT